MKRKRCPYCGRRISYSSSFASRRKAEYVCPKCGKESKVSVRRRNVVLIFGGVACVSLGIMAVWIFGGLVSNPLGILLVAIPLVIFGFASPAFIHYDPLKKYKKSMEAKKAGIAYSDNLLTSELDEAENYTFPSINQSQPEQSSSGGFEINADVFNEIRDERNAARSRINSKESTDEQQNDSYVSVIGDVSETHASSGAGLKKIRSDASTAVYSSPAPRRHYVGENTPQKSKNSSRNRYSQNRKF